MMIENDLGMKRETLRLSRNDIKFDMIISVEGNIICFDEFSMKCVKYRSNGVSQCYDDVRNLQNFNPISLDNCGNLESDL